MTIFTSTYRHNNIIRFGVSVNFCAQLQVIYLKKNDFTPRNAGGIINSSHINGTSGDESFENESETTVRIMITQMTKSTEFVKDLIGSEIRKEI